MTFLASKFPEKNVVGLRNEILALDPSSNRTIPIESFKAVTAKVTKGSEQFVNDISKIVEEEGLVRYEVFIDCWVRA